MSGKKSRAHRTNVMAAAALTNEAITRQRVEALEAQVVALWEALKALNPTIDSGRIMESEVHAE